MLKYKKKWQIMENEEILKTPLNKVLEHLGYDYDRQKSSMRNPVMKNENDKIIISRKGEHYLYFNINVEEDRGNIFNFCKHRGLDYRKVLKSYLNDEKVEKNHTILKADLGLRKDEIKNRIKLFENFTIVDQENKSQVLINRKVSHENLSFKNLRVDPNGNLCFPLYEIKEYNEKFFFVHCGYNEKLINPIKWDRDGKILEKPIKSLIRGKKGLEILAPNAKNEEIENIVITESSLDSISFSEIKGLDNKKAIMIGTGGTITEDALKGLKHLCLLFDKANYFIGFDNDEKGKEFSAKVAEIISSEIDINQIVIAKPKLKDFNDDLQCIKIFNFKKEEFLSMKPMEFRERLSNIRKSMEYNPNTRTNDKVNFMSKIFPEQKSFQKYRGR